MGGMLGRTIAHYKILEELGGGGMGVVYKAEDTKLKRIVALKFLPASVSRDPVAKERFVQEAQAASALDHPNICTIHSIDETEDGRIFIVMAYYEGQTIREKIERGPLPLIEVVDITIQVVEGLVKAHERGIVHRDIKPANLIRLRGGVTKILDFGLAKLAVDADLPRNRAGTDLAEVAATDTTRTDAFMGTPAYMSPEQAQQEPVDHRADIWSLGVTLYEMATGKSPFSGETAAAIIRAILHEDPAPLTSIRPDAPAELERIVNQALAKNPAERYQRLDNMLVDLRLLRSGLQSAGSGEQATSSIVVLPFANMSADPEQEYFCDGVTEEIINALSRVKGLRVVARTSAFAFKGKNVDVREIGRKLNVSAVLEGSVRRSGDTLRVAAQLINVADGYQLWSEQYNREFEDVFAVQDEIAQAIVNTQAVKHMGKQGTPLVKRHTGDMEAYTSYLKGRFHWNKRTEEELKRGIDYFKQAIAKDPSYALAYAGLADCYNILGFYSAFPPREMFPKAKANAVKALKIDDALAEAHTSLAFATLLYDWDWSSAERGFRRGLALNADYATGHHWYAEYLAFMGRMDEAIDVANRALEFDPLSLIINTLIGWVFYYAGDYDRAIEKLTEVLELEPDFVPAHLWLGLAHEQKSQFDEAIAMFEKAIDLSEDSSLMRSALGRAYAISGKTAEAHEVLRRLEEDLERSYVPPVYVAKIYSALGECDDAFTWLERAMEERDLWLVFLKVDPGWAGLRSDPRFTNLMQRVGLPA